MCGRFQLCVETSCSPIYFSEPRWAGAQKIDVKFTRNSLHFEVSCNNNNKYILVLGMPLVYLLLFVCVCVCEGGGGGGVEGQGVWGRLGGTSQTSYFGGKQ